MKCPAWADGEHQFRPGFMVRRLTAGQAFAEHATKSRYPDGEVTWSFTPLDRDDHRTDAKQCSCGLVVKMTKRKP